LRAIGLDGFSRGWVAVSIDGDRRTISFHADIADALVRPSTVPASISRSA